MVMTRRIAPFVYIALGLLAEALFSEKVATVVWVVGALALGAMYSLGLGRVSRDPNSERAAARSKRRGR